MMRMSTKRPGGRLTRVVVAAWAAFAGGAARAADPPPVAFNQHEIEQAWRDHHAMNSDDEALAGQSWDSRRPVAADTAPPVFDDPPSVLRFVLASCPKVAIVYPTETYYYYRFDLDGRHIGGNIRLLDAGQGVLHIGYFNREDRGELRSATFTADDGLKVTPRDDHTFDVEYAGQSVRFVLAQHALARPAGLKLMDYEECVSGILDESGIALVLVFNRLTSCFYYVLNPQIAAADDLDPIAGYDEHWALGRRTGFVFYRDARYQRTLLVAVGAQNVMENSYFDGPFDQVPPRLEIKAKLEAAYPYTRYRGGIDAHGNFVELKDQRVAISPYRTYWDLAEVMTDLKKQEGDSLVAAERWARLTAEAKQGYDPGTAAGSGPGPNAPRYVIQAWPANHWGDNSRGWPDEHTAPISSRWPPNHRTEASVAEGDGKPDQQAGAAAGEGPVDPAASGPSSPAEPREAPK